jgi:hypothetical protein
MRRVIPFVLFLALPLRAAAAEPQKVAEFSPHAAGVALAEVVAVEKYDERPSDGDAGVRFKLKLVRGSGRFRDEIDVVTEHGGLRAPGDTPKPSAPVKPDSLKKGERWWFAFCSEYDYEKHNEGVIGFWPEKDAKAASLEAAVKADSYRRRPQYDPQTKLTFSTAVEKGKWRVLAEKDAKVLWEVALPGEPTDPQFFGLYLSPGGELDVTMPKCEQILLAETDTRLEAGNEFGLPAGPYFVQGGFDPESGKLLARWVRKPQGPHVALVNRAYDPDTGKATFEQRFDFPTTGGKAAGAKAENWYRKIERTLGAGKVTKEETFRYDESAEAGKRWVKVSK